MPTKKVNKGIYWVFTVFNDLAEFKAKLDAGCMKPLPACFQMIVMQKERCPKTKKKHWQGFVWLKEERTRSRLKYYFKHKNIRLFEWDSPSRGVKYATKEQTRCSAGGPFWYGEPK